jgi:FixJ family two-component response regulator
MPRSQTDRSLRSWVAVIDDHPSMRASLTRALQAYGIAVESFGSAEDYLRLGHRARPCCLVLDVQLPGMSGLELHNELVARDPSPPAVILISALEDNLLPASVSTRACGFLQKPFAIDELMELVRPHLTCSADDHQSSNVETRNPGGAGARRRRA